MQEKQTFFFFEKVGSTKKLNVQATKLHDKLKGHYYMSICKSEERVSSVHEFNSVTSSTVGQNQQMGHWSERKPGPGLQPPHYHTLLPLIPPKHICTTEVMHHNDH